MHDEAIRRARQWLNDNRERYQELRPKLEDPRRLLALLVELRGFLDPILEIKSDSAPHSAMFAIGQVQAGIEDVYENISFYHQYQAKQLELEQLVNAEGNVDREHTANLNDAVDITAI